MTGVIFAVISSVFFAMYIIPRKFSTLSTLHYSILTALAFSIGSILIYLLQLGFGNGESFNDPDLLWAVVGGISWGTALVLLVNAIDHIGIARSNQWKNLQGPVGVLLSLVILSEADTVNPYLAFSAGLTIFVSAALMSVNVNTKELHKNKGVTLAVMGGVLFGANATISKFVTDNAGVYSQLVVSSVSTLVFLLAYQYLKGEKSILKLPLNRQITIALSAGALYVGARAFLLLSFENIESSIAFTIIQLHFFLVVAMGIFIFKEFNLQGNKLRVSVGILFALAGIALLTLSN